MVCDRGPYIAIIMVCDRGPYIAIIMVCDRGPYIAIIIVCDRGPYLSKAVQLHTMVAHGGRGGVAPTHS
jgi:hypothetical protein